jgi:hypothetical protein
MDITALSVQITNYLSGSLSSVWALAANFLILLVLSVVMIGFSYKGGRGGIISLLVAFYAGYGIYLAFPYTDALLNAGGTPLIKAVISVVIFLIASFVPFEFIQRLVGGGFGVLSVVPRFALSILAACFLMALAYHVFHVSNIYTFPEPMNTLFGPNQYFFWWFIAPLAGLFFLVH